MGGTRTLSKGRGIPAYPANVVQGLSFDGSVQSAAFGADSRLLRLCASQDCWVKFGANPTAEAEVTSIFLPKGVVECWEVIPGEKVAAIKNSAAGKLSVVELRI